MVREEDMLEIIRTWRLNCRGWRRFCCKVDFSLSWRYKVVICVRRGNLCKVLIGL